MLVADVFGGREETRFLAGKRRRRRGCFSPTSLGQRWTQYPHHHHHLSALSPAGKEIETVHLLLHSLFIHLPIADDRPRSNEYTSPASASSRLAAHMLTRKDSPRVCIGADPAQLTQGRIRSEHPVCLAVSSRRVWIYVAQRASHGASESFVG
ncbi:hypothetical protein VE01_10731 [Pseudogymnoascus verrucosus]|uniref:Uncharacterized protein n=1 Tax=Pseudogymnoascus verrucosus TaxID=342668 RepID=A0A2P6FGR0_9PEZI|nr:uncharacterized protein VE01_10731 [Pseudogymnoascus verrucosus]PQM43835.1 hypothetical protein VE01_10731 [Pseudogymnoascus verrucosus]